jgi:hypothetical protein
MEKHSQRRSGVPGFCPVEEAWVEVIERLRNDFDTANQIAWGRTPVCVFLQNGTPFEVGSENVTELLRRTCLILFEGANKYGVVAPEELGTRLIRSGAAMALSLQKGNSDRKIMMLGRWKSLAFLSYIRPQVLEWAGGMAGDMAKMIPFLLLDVGGANRGPEVARKDTREDQEIKDADRHTRQSAHQTFSALRIMRKGGYGLGCGGAAQSWNLPGL